MSILTWQVRRNLESSLCKFIEEELVSQNITVTDDCGQEIVPDVRVGFNKLDDWVLPVITVYVDNIVAPRSCIGSNGRLTEYLLIIDIRALDIGMQLDLTDWLTTTINDGWTFYDFQPNIVDPQNPIETVKGYVSFDYVSNLPIRLGDNVDLFDKFRQNITLNCCVKLS